MFLHVGNDGSEYRREIDNLIEWCQRNCIALNVSKTKLASSLQEGEAEDP